jgi:hypothetical protein
LRIYLPKAEAHAAAAEPSAPFGAAPLGQPI